MPPRSRDGFVGEIVEVTGPARVSIRRADAVGEVLPAELARIAGYQPSPGDRVAVVWLGEVPAVVGVLSAARGPALDLADGASARVEGDALVLADAEGRTLARYVDGALEIAPSAGDLRLSAPAGRVRIEAGLDVDVRAARDLRLSAMRSAETRIEAREGDVAPRLSLDGKGATVAGPTVEIRARTARLVAGLAQTVAREIQARATRMETTATELETNAERWTQRAQSVVQVVSELLETRAGRVRSLVRGAFSLRSQSTTMKSKEDTAIDGRHVLLG